MIYFFYGNDISSRKKALLEVLKNFSDEPFKIDGSHFDQGALEDLIGSSGLFAKKLPIILENVFSVSDEESYLVGRMQDMADSENAFIFIEDKLDAETVKKVKKFAKEVQNFKLEAKNIGPKFNIFALADSLGKKDKKSLWLGITRAFEERISPEEIVGILFWQVKSMILANSVKNEKEAEEAGLKPFVYQKAKGFSKNYKEEKLKELAGKLAFLLPETRRKSADSAMALERLVLEI